MKFFSIKTKLTLAIAIVYCLIGTSTIFLCLAISKKIITDLGIDYAKRTAISEKVDILSLVNREVTLTKNLVSSPLLKKWCLNESDPNLKTLALLELENYKRSYRDGNLFLIIDKSKHYYYGSSDKGNNHTVLKYTLSPSVADDRWYFDTMGHKSEITLNLDYSKHLNVTNIWINAIIRENGRNVGMGGTGIDITDFLSNLLSRQEKGVSMMLFDRNGSITAHSNREYVKTNSIDEYNKQITVYDLLSNDMERRALRGVLARVQNIDTSPYPITLKINGKSYIAAVSYIKEIGWYTLVLVDATKLLSIWKFAPVLGVLALSLLIVIFISTFLVNWMVLKPLTSLMASSKSIASGDYTVRMESDRADEIGQLTESFNHMVATIDDYTENLENLVAVRTEELRQSNKEITDSIDYAKIIQSSMLPDEGLLKEHFNDHFIIWRPRDIVGGDIYFACKTGNGIIFSVIDCTGHGTSGALMTMTAIAVVQECINRSQALDDPGLILKDINVMMRQVLHQGSRSNRNDNGMDIGMALYLQGQGKLIYSGARLSLIVASDRGIAEIRGDKMSAGYMDSDVDHSFKNHVIDVSGDCALYMASDGLIDQPGGVKGYSLGRKAFHRHLQNTWNQPMDTQRTLLEQMIDDYSKGQDQRDDITVVGFRFR